MTPTKERAPRYKVEPLDADQAPLLATFEVEYFDRTDNWALTGAVALEAGVLVIAQLSIVPSFYRPPRGVRRQRHELVPAGGVNSAVLRDIRVGEVLAGVQAAIAKRGDLLESMRRQHAEHVRAGRGSDVAFREITDDEIATARKAALAALAAPLRRGRRGYPDDLYRQVALTYLDVLRERPAGRGVLDEVARRLSTEGRPVSPETARDWIRRARDLEFLTPATPGKAGAEPGPRLYDLDTKESR